MKYYTDYAGMETKNRDELHINSNEGRFAAVSWYAAGNVSPGADEERFLELVHSTVMDPSFAMHVRTEAIRSLHRIMGCDSRDMNISSDDVNKYVASF